MKTVLLISSLLLSCKTIKEWSPSDHHDMMMSCRVMCKTTYVKSYEPHSGECICFPKKPPKSKKLR